jgi:acetylornithine/N-succinyldiaminopimelate aminotransferase
MNTIEIEKKYMVNFTEKIPLSFEKGHGVLVQEENGDEYLDFTSGWAVTSLGHSHPAIVNAITSQSKKIIHGPNASLTYSPARAECLLALMNILPEEMTKVFFVNSGTEANDAAMKLARKITGKNKILSASMSFHGRTLAATSATGQTQLRDKYNVLVPHHDFFDINDYSGFKKKFDSDTAAVIIEPILGEGGVYIVDRDFLAYLKKCCSDNGSLLIIDEIQTGFYRTGPAFMSIEYDLNPDMITMAKGIAGGFPFGAVAVNDKVAAKLAMGDHGGTYHGNPLGCAVAASVISFMQKNNIEDNVKNQGALFENKLLSLKHEYPFLINTVRGKGLLWAIEFRKKEYASYLFEKALEKGLLLNLKHGVIIRLFPALIITTEEVNTAFEIISGIVKKMVVECIDL